MTHRGLARGFTVVSVHDTDVAWERAGRRRRDARPAHGRGPAQGGGPRAGRRAGLPADTPVAVIEGGTTPQQRTTVATLADVADVADGRGVRSPAVVIVGEVVRLAEALGPAAPTLVLAAHGSPDPRHAATVHEVAEAVRRRGRDVVVGWLGHASPSLPDAVREAGDGAVVVPFLLAPAFHAREDVPAGSNGARVAQVLVPDGEPDVRLVRALATRLAETGCAYDAVVVAAVGSHDPAHAASVQRMAAALATSLGVPVEAAYATASPSLEESVSSLGQPAHRIAVATLFLAPGVLHDRMAAEAARLGVAGVADPLGSEPDVVDLLVARADAAR